MSNRQRMTWAALDRKASAAPQIPGYGVEDQDHPAHTQDDPEAGDYIIGDSSDFGEDPFPPPYGDSGPPALPGYGVEDQDHPAHSGQVGRTAQLKSLVRQRASKAYRLAKATLGKNASDMDLEDQAFNFMSMDDDALDASLDRLSGGFLASDGVDDLPMTDELALEEEMLANFRLADQNDPSGKTLGTSGKSEDQAKAEEKAVSGKSARAKLARLFIACDMDNDGFVTEDDWVGPSDVFAALDTDGDGIIAKHEVLAGEVPEAFKKQWDKNKDDDSDDKDDDSDDKDDSKEAKKARLNRAIRLAKKLAEELEDDEDDEDEEDSKEAKKAGDDSDAEEDSKEAKKAFGHLADFDDDELDMLQAMQYGADDILEDETPADVMTGHLASEDEESEGENDDSEESEDSDKEASFFSGGFDPMGLSDGSALTAADKAAFKDVFGEQDDDDDDEESEEGDSDDDSEESDKEANQRLASLLKPQPRKASTGVKSVGSVAKTASGRNEVAELSNLWASDPDVSGSFS